MEVHLLDETKRTWCPTCRAPTLVTREWVGVEYVDDGVLVTERGRAVECESCHVAVLV